MYELSLALHFIGLTLGVGSGFASGVVMSRMKAAAPEHVAALKQLGPVLSRMSSAGLVLMWLSGGALVWQRGGVEALPPAFWLKFAFVAALTIVVALIEMTYAQVKSGNAAAAARLSMLGPLAGASSILALICAVIAFR